MRILCLGLNHRTATLALRERLAFNESQVLAALARLGCGSDPQLDRISELAILSTCNRVEIYAVGARLEFELLAQFLATVREVPRRGIWSYLYRLSDEQAVSHLFRVAAGLDSLVLGEPQILGQVTRSLALARSQGATGKILERLFTAAIHAGKRARTETSISRNPTSVATLAVRLAGEVFVDLVQARVVVLGAGQMAELAVEALRTRGAERIQVVNRTLTRARDLAALWGGEATTFENLAVALQGADILIASTGAPHTLVHPAMLERVMADRPDRPLVILDIAVPRDVDPQVADLPGVHLYDLDALEDGLADCLSARQSEVPGVEAILAQEKAYFLEYLRALEVVPLIAEMRHKVEEIRQTEIKKALRRMPHLSVDDQQRLDALTQALVKKVLHTPITTLRAEAGGPEGVEIAAVARRIFGLNGQSGAETPSYLTADAEANLPGRPGD